MLMSTSLDTAIKGFCLMLTNERMYMGIHCVKIALK